ncbi:hypothetical protein G6F65_023405 [Rhizopus arrhizus]|nr:hypothetical protein G6F65_023405 [Rhizopus arrhizus]
MGGVTHQHDGHAALAASGLQRVPVHPGVADDAREADPDGRAAQAMPSSWLICSMPGACQVSSGVSTMKVDMPSS